MSLLGRLWCWLTGRHAYEWVEPDVPYIVPEGNEIEWCPRCTKIRGYRNPDGEGWESPKTKNDRA